MNNKIKSIKCELCEYAVINYIVYKLNNKYICSNCFARLKKKIVKEGKIQKDGEFIDFVR